MVVALQLDQPDDRPRRAQRHRRLAACSTRSRACPASAAPSSSAPNTRCASGSNPDKLHGYGLSASAGAGRGARRRTCSSPPARSAAEPSPTRPGLHRDGVGRRPLHARPSSSSNIILRADSRRHDGAPQGRRARRASARSRYGFDTQWNGKPTGAFAIQLLPGANALRRRRPRCARRWTSCSRASRRACSWFAPYDIDDVRHDLDRGSGQDAGRGDRAGVPRDADVPAELARDDHPDAGDPGRAARHVPRHVDASASRSTS